MAIALYDQEHLRDYAPGWQASWEVDVWGKLRNRKRAAINRYLASVEGRDFVVTSLIAEIASSYYELLAYDSEMAILNETIRLQENAYEVIQVQKDAGVANELAVRQFEAQLLNSRSMRAEAHQRVLELENNINFLMGRYPHRSPVTAYSQHHYLQRWQRGYRFICSRTGRTFARLNLN